ncbi:MAG: UTP--glucose-1-phosphate uridylyltransferase [Bacillaceae bacterium]|nr:UTP--glucose-1-phosphate uridylyltransferase [Bacillaceae bacterium]
MEIKKAIIPAAGYGTRSLPITKVLPKEMFPVGEKPAIHYVVEEAVASGIKEILIVVSRNKNMIIDYFDRSLEIEMFLMESNKQNLISKLSLPDVHIQFIRQPYANGLGDAIALGESFLKDGPFAVLLPDDVFITKRPCLLQLIEAYNEHKSNVIAVKKVKKKLLKKYGVIEGDLQPDQLIDITNIVEKPQGVSPSKFAVVGRYILTPSIFGALRETEHGSGGEIQLTDAIKRMLRNEKCFGKIINGERYDIGSSTDYLKLLKKMPKIDS